MSKNNYVPRYKMGRLEEKRDRRRARTTLTMITLIIGIALVYWLTH